MIDPRTVLIGIPCHSGTNMSELTGALVAAQGLYASITIPTECSHPSLVRNIIADTFMRSNFEWLVCIDSDIYFRREDLQLLLEPCDKDAIYFEDNEDGCPNDDNSVDIATRTPRPTRVTTGLVVDEQFDFNMKTSGAADVLVCSEYSYKNDDLEPVKFGFGFVRIHRSVFETLQNLKHEGNDEVSVRRDLMIELKSACDEYDSIGTQSGDPNYGLIPKSRPPRVIFKELFQSSTDIRNTPRLWQTSHKGRMFYDYFPSGPILSQHIPSAEWRGEDHGFFTLTMLAGIIPRIETRTRLIHIGRKGYPYMGPNYGGGQ